MKILSAKEEEVELSATHEELDAIASGIQRLATSGEAEFLVEAVPAKDPRPFDRCLLGLTVRRGDGPVSVRVEEDLLVIEGHPRHLEDLSSYFSFAPEEKYPDHGHLQYYPEHPFLREDAVPLVISIEGGN